MAELNDRCFCYFTPCCMGTNMASPYKALYIWVEHFLNNAQINYRTNLNLGKVVYISIIFHIPVFELIYWKLIIFICDGVTLQPSHWQTIVLVTKFCKRVKHVLHTLNTECCLRTHSQWTHYLFMPIYFVID